MNKNGAVLSKRWILFALFLAVLAAAGCSTKMSKSVQNGDPKPTASDDTHSFGGHLIGGTYCVQIIPQGPPVSQAIHFSNKQSESDGSSKDFESDLLADKFDVTFHERHHANADDQPGSTPEVRKDGIHAPARTTTVSDGFAELVQTSHYTRSDDHEWVMGSNAIANGGTPWGIFVNKPPVTKVGTETISGYETVKYAIDTTHQSEMEKAALLIAGQLKDYNIVGTAWVAKDGACILQYQIEYEEDAKDGTARKVHYEGGISRQ